MEADWINKELLYEYVIQELNLQPLAKITIDACDADDIFIRVGSGHTIDINMGEYIEWLQRYTSSYIKEAKKCKASLADLAQ